jgi:tryptophan halogenase
MMSESPVKSIVIVGGGTAGWMSAAAFAKLLGGRCLIRVIESDEIATIGVGEATIPHIKAFNAALGIDENDFLRQTGGTFKLGIEFVNWGAIGESYIHGFGSIGQDLAGISCHHYWIKMRQRGMASELGRYSLNTAAPHQAKYMRSEPRMAGSPLADIPNAFHFDAGRYAHYLRGFSEALGVRRTEGRIVQTRLRSADGAIESVVLASGEVVSGDFFVDCSGMRALLLGEALGEGYEDWSHWLPCDRAVAVPCAAVEPLLPMTRATAHSAGWQWRIPLQHRIGNGHVYSSRFMGQDEATGILLANLDAEALAPPRHIAFTPGRRQRTWVKNCVAIGLSSGFFEPIESTNIHLIQTAIQRVVSLFPDGGFDPASIAEYNRLTQEEYERIRDFIVLHYKATRRDDSPFWNHCRTMSIPDSLQHRLELYAGTGRVFRDGLELFAEVSWVQVMAGQGVVPKNYHPLVDLQSEETVQAYLGNIESVVGKCVAAMPTHADFVRTHCAELAATP